MGRNEMKRLDARDACMAKMRELANDPWAMDIGKVRDGWVIFRPMDGNTVASAMLRCDCKDALLSAGFRRIRNGTRFWYSAGARRSIEHPRVCRHAEV